MAEISGIRRSQNADEGVSRFFQTTFQLVGHFKREADKKLIYQLSSDSNTLSKLLISASAVHCYHYLGIRTQSDSTYISNAYSESAFENSEKKDLFSEIEFLLGSAIQYGLDLNNHILDYEERIIQALFDTRKSNNENFLLDLKDDLEEHLINALNKYPSVFFYDHVGNLTGYSSWAKNQIISKSRELKTVGIDLERDLESTKTDDQCLELSALSLLEDRLHKEFEFNSLKDLKMEMFPLRKMLSRIVNYQFNRYPISKRGLNAYLDSIELNRQLLGLFKEANEKPVNYPEFEKKILNVIKDSLKNYANKGANSFTYYLQALTERSFREIIGLLEQFGILDVDLFCHLSTIDLDQFSQDMRIMNLSKMDFIELSKSNNIIVKVENELNKLKKSRMCVTESSVIQILDLKKEYELNYIKDACTKANVEYDSLIQLFNKKKLIDKFYMPKYKIDRYQGFITLFDIEDIYSNLVKFIYFHYFGRISQQLARIVETYIRLKKDKALLLLGLERVFRTEEQEKWVAVKIEELLIQRIMERQKELSIVFDKTNEWEEVNAFILARLLDVEMNQAKSILVNDPSPFYESALDLPLSNLVISPVSYVLGYDIIQRLKSSIELRQLKKEQTLEAKEQALNKKKAELKEQQLANTLNWIDKKITSTLMSVSTKINPSSLYWTDKDQKIAVDNIVTHSELEGKKICPECFEDIGDSQCLEHNVKGRKANPYDLFVEYYSFALKSIKKQIGKFRIPSIDDIQEEVEDWLNEAMKKRLRRPVSRDDSKEIITGERLIIAGKIAESIGQFLDKAIYRKFKKTLKN